MSEEGTSDSKALDFVKKFKNDLIGNIDNETPVLKKPKLEEDGPNLLPPRATPPIKPNALPPRAPPPSSTKPSVSRNTIRSMGESIYPSEKPRIAPRPTVQGVNNSTKSIVEVSSKQMENELLNHLTGWKENKFLKDVDYVVNDDIVILYLSLEFHKIRPGYIERRVSGMREGNVQTLKILLVHVDAGDWEKSLAELNAFCLFQNLTLVIGWSFSECADYLQYLKTIRNSTMIKTRRTDDREVVNDKVKLQERVSQVLRAVPRMDKTTASKLMAKHHTMKKIVSLGNSQLQQVDRMGAVRAAVLVETLNAPFTSAQENSQSRKR